MSNKLSLSKLSDIPSVSKFSRKVHLKAVLTLLAVACIIAIYFAIIGFFKIDFIILVKGFAAFLVVAILIFVYQGLCWIFVDKEELISILNQEEGKKPLLRLLNKNCK